MDPAADLWKLICDLSYWTIEGLRTITNYFVKSTLDQLYIEHRANHEGSQYTSWCQFCKLEFERRRNNLESGVGQDTVDWNS